MRTLLIVGRRRRARSRRAAAVYTPRRLPGVTARPVRAASTDDRSVGRVAAAGGARRSPPARARAPRRAWRACACRRCPW
jgi:hypothetical protein